jgi:phosphotransferase system enzyme I (PtsI)
MEILKGTPVFPGIAIGKIKYYAKEELFAGNVKKELMDFEEARNIALSQLEDILRAGEYDTKEEEASLREQINLLFSGKFIRAIEGIIVSEKKNAPCAIKENRDEMTELFSKLETPAIVSRITSIRKISDCMLNILGTFSVKLDFGEEPVILLADRLTPAEIMEMKHENLLAVVVREGSSTSHAAILAKTMEIPALMESEIDKEWDGSMAIVDCFAGRLYINPDEDLQKEYELRKENGEKEWQELLTFRTKPDRTLDGEEVGLYANIGNLDDVKNVLFYGAAGIGLLRSEFQYLGREGYPRENELYEVYKEIAQTMGEKVAIIRTADFGVEKEADYMELPTEKNPLMGNRGIRILLDRKRMFRAQLRAIYRASAYGRLAVLYPMISSESEMDEIEELTSSVRENLKSQNIPFKEIETGIMIETPAAVMMARELARRADFLAIGTNDLTQYTLAMDRQNPLLKNKYDDHHPAVLKMIQMTIEAGHAEGKKVYICGEIAADTALTETFLQMGVDGLSVVPAAILPVRRVLRASHRRKIEE